MSIKESTTRPTTPVKVGIVMEEEEDKIMESDALTATRLITLLTNVI